VLHEREGGRKIPIFCLLFGDFENLMFALYFIFKKTFYKLLSIDKTCASGKLIIIDLPRQFVDNSMVVVY